MIKLTLIIVAISYLLGSIPFGYLLVRIFRGQDVRETGSGNIGATNVARTGSKVLAVATLVLDALKGYTAVAIAFHMNGASCGPGPVTTFADTSGVPGSLEAAYLGAALAGFCAILGHMFPVWLRFKGGKGVATALGAFVAISPRAALAAVVFFVIIVAVTRYVSLGSVLGTLVFPFVSWWLNPFTRTPGVIVLMTACALLIVARHKDNLQRLLTGTENRFR